MRSDNLILDLRENYRGPDLQLFFRDIRDPQNRKRKILVKTWSTIQDVKNAISCKIQVSPQLLRLYYVPLIVLPNHRTLSDAGIYRHGETILLDILQENHVTETDLRVATYMCESTPKMLMDIIQHCRTGLFMGYKPELVLDGSGGTYFLHNSCKAKIAVFKPSDEEPYAENNPRGYVGDGILRAGIAPGQACIREVAAFLLDHSHFCRVPMTTLVEACHPAFHINGAKLNVAQGGASIGSHSFAPHKSTLLQPHKLSRKFGSLQVFIKADCTMDDLSPSKIHKDEVHRIAILDIRLMNSDRNSANLLCRRRSKDGLIELIPIDHGFCLRSVCDVSWMDWCWLDWPQMKEVRICFFNF
jgi:Phosphatidylinositol 3- and 4-kinase